MMETSLSPLTLTETRDIINLKAAYGQFWRSQKFAKGYDSPFCSRSDVEKALSEAAEIVVRLRSHLDRLHSEKDTKRVLAGASQEHLFALDIADTPSSFDPAQFARDLVHATLRDSQGYVEELNEGIIDNFIEQVRAYRDVRTSEQLSTIEQCEVLYNDVLQQWSRDQELLNQALPKEATERTAAFDALSLSDLQSLKAQLAAVEQTLRSLRLNRLRITRSAFLDAPDTPFHVEQQSGHHTDPTDEARAEAFAAVEQHPTTDAIVVSTTDDEQSTVTPSPTTAVDDDDDDEQHNNNNNSSSSNNEPTSVQDDAENGNETEEKAAESTASTDEDADAQVRSEAFIAIEKVASHVDQVASEFKGMLGEVEPLWSEEQSTLCSRPIESLKKIEGLHSTVVGYSEELLQDLMRLDDIEVDPQARAERKRHVIAIQALMDDLDGVASKLKSLKDVLKVEAEKVKASSPERTASPSLSSSSSTTAASSQTPPSTHGQQQAEAPLSRSSLSSAWDKLKLDLQWDKEATRRSYLIRTMIPGLDRDKIKFELAQDGSAFTISGCRVPTPREEQELRQFIKRRYRYPPSEEDSLLLRVASGRYGSFRNTFSLPDDALPDQLRPTYDRGILQIEVPRRQVVQQRVPRSFGGYPGYPSRQGAFFNDRDLWW